jgi:AGZA family xanthine/uracil permease-like MFS transporter
MAAMDKVLNGYFRLDENRTNVRTEIMAGITTFLTMAYIIFVNPSILKATGMDPGALFTATCLAAAYGSIVMGMWANYPVAMAPGMGLNAYFSFGVVMGMKQPWQAALGAVFVSGILAFILSALPIREYIVNAIPKSLKMAISAGIGLFLGIIALENAGVIVAHPATLVTLGKITAPAVALAAIGFIAMIALDARKVPGSIIIAILGVTAIGILLGITPFRGLVDVPPSPLPGLFKLDIAAALQLGVLTIVFTFFFVDFFDTTGTLVGVAHRAGMLDKDGKLPRLGSALMADSSASIVAAVIGTSSTTSYIESAAGVKAGGRTGLMAVTVGALFLLSLFLAPLALSIPAFATAPALLFVACLMARGITEVDWEDVTEYAPAVICALTMPLTFSIAHGIAFGFIAYAAAKILAGRPREAHPAVIVIAALFLIKFILVS